METPARFQRREVWLVVMLLLIGAALRFYRLEDIPPRISADEYTTTVDTFEILNGKGPALFGFDWKPMPALTTHATALLMRVTGPSILGLRLLSIVLSLIAGVVLFVLLRWWCATGIAWAAAVVLLSNPWFLNFSRSGWENLHVGTYWLVFTWCFFSGLAAVRGRWLYYGGAGAALALSLYGYFTGRLILVGWLLFFPFARAVCARPWRDIVVAYASVVAVAAILFAPQIPVIARDWDRFQSRVRTVSLWSGDPAAHGYRSHLGMAGGQLWRATRYLLVGSPIGGVHYSPSNRPPFHWLLVPFLVIGLVRGLVRWRVGLWWWLLLIVSLISTQGLSVATDPNLARMAGACVVFFWFIGYGADWLLRLAREPHRRLAVWAFVIGALVISVDEWRYFEGWMSSGEVANARGGGVTYWDYRRWQEIQFARIAAGQRPVHVIEWERPEVRAALFAAPTAVLPR